MSNLASFYPNAPDPFQPSENIAMSELPITSSQQDPNEVKEAEPLLDRRAALHKLGALAAWTTPVLITLALPRRTSAESLPETP